MYKTLSISSALSFMFSGLLAQIGNFIGLGLFWTAVFIGIRILQAMAMATPVTIGLALIFYLISVLCFSFYEMQNIRLAMAAYREESISWGSLFEVDLSQIVKFTMATMLRGIAVFFGIVAFIIPGIYIAMMYAFPGYTLIDGITDSLHDDFAEISLFTTGVRGRLFVAMITFWLFFAPFVVLSFILLSPSFIFIVPLVVFILLVDPMVMLFNVHLYEQLKMQQSISAS